MEHTEPSYKVIANILLKDWDPIGIQDIPEAQDEYDAYIPEWYRMLLAKNSVTELCNYLEWIVEDCMGLSGNTQHTQLIAEKLSNLFIEVSS